MMIGVEIWRYFVIYIVYVITLSLPLIFVKICKRGSKRQTYLCGEVLPLSLFKMEAKEFYKPFIETFERVRRIERENMNNKLYWMLLFFVVLTFITFLMGIL